MEMDKLFLDYYHPYAGLCNQLYLITNHIHNACVKNKEIYIHKFNTDIFHKKRVPFGEIIDIERTNKNLKRLTGRMIISPDAPPEIHSIETLRIYPVSSIEILNCLEFHGKFIEITHTLKYHLNHFNGVHFRLDFDAVLHYTYGTEMYNRFMENKDLDINWEIIETYCEFLMNQYLEYITQVGFDNPWYICTGITRSQKHNPMNKYLIKLLQFIEFHGGKYFIPKKFFEERELNAIVDLIMLRDSEIIIGFEGSSFSEGYCYKVNSIRSPDKKYFFVKFK